MRGVGGAPIRGAMHVLVGGGGGGSYSGGGAYGGGLRQGIIASGGGGYPAALSSRGGGGYRPMPGRQVFNGNNNILLMIRLADPGAKSFG